MSPRFSLVLLKFWYSFCNWNGRDLDTWCSVLEVQKPRTLFNFRLYLTSLWLLENCFPCLDRKFLLFYFVKREFEVRLSLSLFPLSIQFS